MSQVDSLARAVLARIASKRRPRKRAIGLAGAVASAVAGRLNAPGARKSARPNRLAGAVASAVAQRLGQPGGPADARPNAASAASKTLAGTQIASRVARQVASRIPETRSDFGSDFAAVDVAKVAEAVIAKLDARKSKGIDHVDVLASQIASRLASPRLQGSAAGAIDFRNRIVAAVVDAVTRQRAKAVEAAQQAVAAKPSEDVKSASGEKSASVAKQS
ncbi:hypothetical protein V5279_45970 (plasmid) [Bradyrhizobium sp. 26S5]